eukprot:3867222-Rhodomonas_salina.2
MSGIDIAYNAVREPRNGCNGKSNQPTHVCMSSTVLTQHTELSAYTRAIAMPCPVLPLHAVLSTCLLYTSDAADDM